MNTISIVSGAIIIQCESVNNALKSSHHEFHKLHLRIKHLEDGRKTRRCFIFKSIKSSANHGDFILRVYENSNLGSLDIITTVKDCRAHYSNVYLIRTIPGTYFFSRSANIQNISSICEFSISKSNNFLGYIMQPMDLSIFLLKLVPFK